MALNVMHRRLWTLAAVASGVLLVAGCGSSSTGSSTSAGSAGQAIRRAAYVSNAASGYRVAISLKEGSTALGGEITGTGTGTFNGPKRAGRVSLHLNLPGSLASAGTLTVQEILRSQTMYVKLPAQVASQLPGGRPWIKIDLAQAARAEGIQNLTSLFSGSGSTNPSQFLQYLKSAGPVKKLGSANVDGYSTTHYRVITNLQKAAAAARSSQRGSLGQAIANLEKLTGLHSYPVDVWVDSQHLVRRMIMAYTVNAAGQSLHTQIRLDFVSYGSQPVPQAPPAGQVTDASSMLAHLKG